MRNEDDIIIENKRRLNQNSRSYNPLTGEGADSCKRRKIELSDAPEGYSVMYLPERMFKVRLVALMEACGSLEETCAMLGDRSLSPDDIWEMFVRIRIMHDFEFWAFCYVVIKEKGGERDIPFLLNRGQRKLLRYFYRCIEQGVPIRIILLKARQWGGSTLVQIFFIWIQLCIKEQWHSVVCAHVENTAKVIRGMYTKMLKHYPPSLLFADEKIELLPFENSQKTRYIKQRGCRITIGSAERPDGIRGDDISMAHLSEVGLWKKTQGKSAEDLVQAIVSGIASKPYTAIVYESTAKGVGNFFHTEWLRAKDGNSAFTPVFVAWFEIDNYQKKIDDYHEFIASLSADEMMLFDAGATLEAICWYREKRTEYKDLWRFMSEFPSFDFEAFQSTGSRYYSIADVQRLRKMCSEPVYTGDVIASDRYGASALTNIRLSDSDERGCLKIWDYPETDIEVSDRYVVVVDIGGLSDKADRSVICVIDRYWMSQDGVPQVVAEWCGHIEHYLLAWKAAQIATMYGKALLVVESNTYETERTEGDHYVYILDEIAEHYSNLYCRTTPDQIRQGLPPRWGFHMNKSSKDEICSHMRKCLREDLYIERCREACDEFDTFEQKPNGELGAVDGCHDDRHITRAIGIYIAYKMPMPKEIDRSQRYTIDVVSEASI